MSEKVMEINYVEGFNPAEHLRVLDTETNEVYLDVKWRLYWFRLKYPEGKITTNVIQVDFDKGVAVVQATVHADKTAPEDQFLARALGQRFRSAEEFGDRFVELAETSAIGRALADAGFGTQFCTVDLPKGDSEVVDAPIETTRASTPAGTEETGKPSGFTGTPVIPEGPPAAPPARRSSPRRTEPKPMTFDDASKMLCDIGKFRGKGKTMGEVMGIDPSYIAWLAEKDLQNPKLKEAALILVEAAKKEAA